MHKFNINKIREDRSYSMDDPLFDILINKLPPALEEIVTSDAALLREALLSAEKEEELRQEVFHGKGYFASKEFSRELDAYRKEGRDFFRKLAFNAGQVYAKHFNLSTSDLQPIRYIYVVGLSQHQEYYFEDTRALMRVLDWTMVSNLPSYLEERTQLLGRAFLKLDLIYSHRDELFDEKGYVLGKEKKQQNFIQVAEGLMFTKNISEKEQNTIEEKIIKALAEKIFTKKNISNAQLQKMKEDIIYIMHIGDLHSSSQKREEMNEYPNLYNALFQTIAYTVTIKDLIDIKRVQELPAKRSELGKFLAINNCSNVNVFSKILEDIVYNQSLIKPPLGVVLFGWKGQSLADKLVIATEYDTIRKDEENLKSFLKSKGITPKKGHYSRRQIFDSLRATFITYGSHQEPFTYDKNGEGIPQRDIEGENTAYDLFGYFNGLSGEDLERIKNNQHPALTPKFSHFGLNCNWKNNRNFENYLVAPKESGYRSLNTISAITTERGITHAEIDYRPNVDDRRSLTGEQDHTTYKLEQQIIVDWLVNQKNIISPEELMALRMLISPQNKYLHF